MTVVVLTVLILLDLLFSLNDYDRFFKILGFELLIVGIIWVIGLRSDHRYRVTGESKAIVKIEIEIKDNF